MRLHGRTLVITGATSGIGRALADRLANSNRLIVVGRSSARSTALLEAHPKITFLDADLAEPGDVERAGAVVAEAGEIDGLINCAAVQETPALPDPAFDLDAMHREIAINFTAVCHLTARLLPLLVQRSEAFVLNVNSGLGLVPKTSSAVYCGTKGGLNIFTLALRNQLRGTPVRALQAFLPLVDTPMTEGRGTGKISAADAAGRIIAGIERGVEDNDIGKVKLLRRILRMSPALARRIMRDA